MKKPKNSNGLGKRLLLTAAIGTAPLMGCTLDEAGHATSSTGNQIVVSAQENALYQQAVKRRDAGTASAFLRTFPRSELVPVLLPKLSSTTLRNVDRRAVQGVPKSTLAALPRNVRLALGVASSTQVNRPRPGDGYAG